MTDQNAIIAVTMGDPAGVGPETIVRAWRDDRLHAMRQIVAVGNPEVFRRAIALFGDPIEVTIIDSPAEASSSRHCLPVLATSPHAVDVAPCTVDPRGGMAAYEALLRGAQLALAGDVDAIVTAPLHKTALAQAGIHCPGHTELLGEICGTPEPSMMLYLPPGRQVAGPAGLGVAHVTLHTSLRSVFQELTSERIVRCAERTSAVMQALGGGDRVAVCALNPHAGENGLFGDEEMTIIGPAVQQCRQAGWSVNGPLPADTLMMRAASGEFDGVVAMYHDQGHIALKLLGMHAAVNITLGLPIVRTSVAHGTAFDLAWRGQAEASGVLAAVEVADRLARARKRDATSVSAD